MAKHRPPLVNDALCQDCLNIRRRLAVAARSYATSNHPRLPMGASAAEQPLHLYSAIASACKPLFSPSAQEYATFRRDLTGPASPGADMLP